MKTVQLKKAVSAVLALRQLKTPTWESFDDDDLILDPSEISTLVTAYQYERPSFSGLSLLH